MRKTKTEEEFESINDLRKREVLESLASNPGMSFLDIFKVFPKTAFSQECGLHTTGFPKKVEKPEIIRVEEILKIAEYLKLEPAVVFSMVGRSIKSAKKSASKKRKSN